ncbi:sigma-70 family RNA polymerase sigma factor [uncultured Arenimonas sp.]|uniref:RNA polymerase sigma factor n=1 Tax=uncultured Arenimonas sp. TaxID=546226 RepID=UPI0030D77995
MSPDILNTLIERDLPAAQGGDTVAYGRLVAATQRMVASVALAITRDLQASEDIAQETFLTAWQRRGQLDNPQSFLPWLRQVARNRAIDHVRARRYRETPVDPLEQLSEVAAEPGHGPADSHERSEQARQLAEALDEIPETSRDVLLLYYREGERSADVAALLGISDAAVRKRLQRGRDALREQLLKRLSDVARESAPGVAFTVAVGVGLAGSGSAGAAVTTGAAAKAAGWSVKAVLGALAASVTLVVGAVWLEVRLHLRRARSDAERRSLVHNGVVYAALMATYMVVLSWANYANWSATQFILAAVAFSAAIFLLTYERVRSRRRHRGQ